jgi:acetyl-CoA carboxylase beta subunit
MVVHRNELKDTLARLLAMLMARRNVRAA